MPNNNPTGINQYSKGGRSRINATHVKVGDFVHEPSLGRVQVLRVNKNKTMKVRFYNRYDEPKHVVVRIPHAK